MLILYKRFKNHEIYKNPIFGIRTYQAARLSKNLLLV
jgi:hypothetical protein